MDWKRNLPIWSSTKSNERNPRRIRSLEGFRVEFERVWREREPQVWSWYELNTVAASLLTSKRSGSMSDTAAPHRTEVVSLSYCPF